jgi:3-deoxy-D-manno-octulosonic acid (KDO) 8-phosphate synthase
MVEVHPRPDEALSDGEQSITLEQFAELMAALRSVHAQIRDLHDDPVLSGAALKVGGASRH